MEDTLEVLKAKAEKEPIASFLETRLVELEDSYAKVTMKLKPEYLNFNGMIFGGIIMCLADQAFAYATNSVITTNVASQFNIHFIADGGPREKYMYIDAEKGGAQ